MRAREIISFREHRRRRCLVTAAAAIAVSALALPAAARDDSVPRGEVAANPQLVTPLIPPVPQPARRPSPTAGMPDSRAMPIIPPVPQPAVRPQRLAAISQAQQISLIPPVPQPVTRRQWLAALSERELPVAAPRGPQSLARDAESDRLRACLKSAARALLDRIEAEFGAMKIISTCRAGARIAGTGRISKHATGEAIDFDAGSRKADVVRWLIANHTTGGTMTYADMSHIHVDVGQHFVALGARSGR